jgi:cohesin complex subunit SA-1/2
LRLLATGTLLDSHVLFSTLNPAKSTSKDAGAEVEADNNNPYVYLETLVQEIEPKVQEELTSIFVTAEKQYAKKAKKALEPPADDDEPEDIESDSEDDEDDEEDSDSTRKADTLKAEQKLCELAGKLVLAILAGVIDGSGPLKGKLRTRIQRNRNKLGPNFREVVAYLDDPKPKDKGGKKSHKSKAQQAAAIAAEAKKKSAERVVEDDDGDEEEVEDPFAEPELEEAAEEPDGDENAGNDRVATGEADEDDVMGD